MGLWDGSIQSRAGEVSFGIELKQQGSAITAVLVNATDRQPFSSAAWDGHTLTLRLDYYDGQLTLHYVSAAAHGGRILTPDQQGHGAHSGCADASPEASADKAVDWSESRRRLAAARSRRRGRGEEYPHHLPAAERWPLRMARSPPQEFWSRSAATHGLLHGAVVTGADGRTHFHLSRFDGIHVLALDGELLRMAA